MKHIHIDAREPSLLTNRTWRRVLFFVAGLAIIHVACFVLVYLPYGLHGYGDFTILYTGGSIINAGNGAHLYDPQAQWDIQQKCCKVPTREAPLLFNHAPYEALFLAPLARLPYRAAYLLWLVLNLGMLALTGFALRKYLASLLPRWWLFPLAALAWVPVFVGLVQGQSSFMLTLFYAVAFVCMKRGHPLLAGASIALAGSKPQLVLPFILILALKRQWKVVAGFVGCGALLLLISAAVVGPDAVVGYADFLVKFSRLPVEMSAAAPFNMPNLRGLLLRLLDFGFAAPWRGAVVVLLSIPILWIAARFRSSEEEEFSMAIVATLLVSYHLYAHDVTLLLVPVILLTARLLAGTTAARRAYVLGTSPWLLLAVLYFLTARGLFCAYAVSLGFFALAIWRNARSAATQAQTKQVPVSTST